MLSGTLLLPALPLTAAAASDSLNSGDTSMRKLPSNVYSDVYMAAAADEYTRTVPADGKPLPFPVGIAGLDTKLESSNPGIVEIRGNDYIPKAPGTADISLYTRWDADSDWVLKAVTHVTVLSTEEYNTYNWIQKPANAESDAAESSGSGTDDACTHTWKTMADKEATCTQDGSLRRSCTKCGETEYETISAVGHNYQSRITRSPSELQEGERTYTCKNCGDIYTEEIRRTPAKKTEIKQDATSENTGTSSVSSGTGTSTSTGGTNSTSSSTVSDTDSQTDGDMVDVLGHSYKRIPGGTYFARASISTGGNQQFTPRIGLYDCPAASGQKHTLSYHKAVAACEDSDFSYQYCTVCGEKELSYEAPALGHDYKSLITKPATEMADGVMTYTCTRCQNSYTESIPMLKGTSESSVSANPAAQAYASDNQSNHNYFMYANRLITSYLYRRDDGGYTRVEAAYKNYNETQHVVVEHYDSNFKLLSSRTIPKELQAFCGFYAGTGYNFLIFGSANQSESPSTEVMRVVKYSKDWERLGHASLSDCNIYAPVDASSLRCTEYNGMLYITTARLMYKDKGGDHHQANFTFSVRESDMTVTDHSEAGLDLGYVSHSFNQFPLINREGYLVTLNHGDGGPRAAVLFQYAQQAGTEKTITTHPNGAFLKDQKSACAIQFVQDSVQYNYTGAMLGGFQESSAGYLTALATVEQKDDVARKKTYNVQVILTKRDFKATEEGKIARASLYSTPVQLTNYAEGGEHSVGNPYLVKLSDDRFLVLWEIQDKKTSGTTEYYDFSGTLGYAFVDANGRLQGEAGTVQGRLSDCEPIVSGSKAVWYVTNDSTPCFYAFDTDSRTITTVGGEGAAAKKTQSQTAETTSTAASGEKGASKTETAGSQKSTKITTVEKKQTPDEGATAKQSDDRSDTKISTEKKTSQVTAGSTSVTAGEGTSLQPLVFADVTTQWFKPYIDKATAAKLMFGTGSGKFDPQGNLTIAQAMTLAYQIHSKATGGTLPQASGAWYMPYYQYCKDHGIGETGRFSVSDLSRVCTRFEMVDILDQAIPQSRMSAVKSVDKIPDLAENTANAKNVYKWYRAGILSGNSNGEFMGGKSITRAEVAVILCQINQL